jgi:hypothetical protein
VKRVWDRCRDGVAAAEHVREYLQAAKPSVALTVGGKVSGTAVGAFHYETSIKPRQLVGSILSKYDESLLKLLITIASSSLRLPFLAQLPTAAASSRYSFRVLYEPVSIAWSVADQVMIPLSRASPGRPTRKFCDRVVRAVRQKTGHGTDWGRRFQEDKDEVWKTREAGLQTCAENSIEMPTNDTN